MPFDRQMSYGGLPRKETVSVNHSGWGINTPTIMVEGCRDLVALVQGGIHSEYAQLPHKVRGFVFEDYPVICLSQSGATTVQKSPGFYGEGRDYSRFVQRDVAILNTYGVDRVIAYGSSIGAAASIALAAEHPDRVAAVIAVNPASLIQQPRVVLTTRFLLSMRDRVVKDFKPLPTSRVTLREAAGELLGGVAKLAASNVGLHYLERVKCPVIILTGRQDIVFPHTKLLPIGERFPDVTVKVMEKFSHNDPNSRGWMRRVFLVAQAELGKLGVEL